MAPEQLEGAEADARADIFAFGCVLYEMLAGKKAFHGKTQVSLIGAILKDTPPPISSAQAAVPAALNWLIGRCLAKDPDRRWQTAADLVSQLEFIAEGDADAPSTTGVKPAARTSTRTRVLFAAAAVVVAAATGAAAWWLKPSTPRPGPVRFTITPATEAPLAIISPYRDVANELKKVSITGGPPISLCRVSGQPSGGSWGPDDTIVFATSDRGTGLMSVPAGGGEPKVLTKPDSRQGELDHIFPFVLPGGRAVLFTIVPNGGADMQVAVLDLKSGQRRTIIRGGGQAEYAETGHIVYAAAGSLRAVRFDPVRLEVLSDPVPVVEQVMTKASGAAQFSLSSNGTLIYMAGGAAAGGSGVTRTLVWVDRQGREEPVKAPPRAYVYPRLSPDGTKVALEVRDQDLDIWIWDFAHEALRAQSGRELFFVAGDRTIMSVPVQLTPGFSNGNPSKVFEGPYVLNLGGAAGRSYDVSKDGQKFLVESVPSVRSLSTRADENRPPVGLRGAVIGNRLLHVLARAAFVVSSLGV
jgi:serine/threonine-protein kinase